MLIHPRVHNGQEAQTLVRNLLPHDAQIISVASVGSNRPDLIVDLGGHITQIEIKSCNSLKSPIALLSCTVQKNHPRELIDNIISLFTDDNHLSVNELIDYHASNNQRVGFPCDYGTSRSGTLPKGLTLSLDHVNMPVIHQYVLTHLRAMKNTYLAIVCKRPSSKVHIFFTGYGHNILNAPLLPLFNTARITTYGIASLTKMRLAVKVTFAIGHSI